MSVLSPTDRRGLRRSSGNIGLFVLAMLLSGLAHAQQQEPIFRGIQPKETIIDAWKREDTRPAKSPVTHGSKAQKPAQAGVPLSFLIIFEYNSAELTETAKKQLDGVADAIKSSELSRSRFTVEGHTDIIGSEPFNLALSKQRAEAVRDYLIHQQGISASKLSAVGVGERDLYDPADPTAEENRRVRIIRYAG